jgi:hypothetical protein
VWQGKRSAREVLANADHHSFDIIAMWLLYLKLRIFIKETIHGKHYADIQQTHI